MDLSKLERMKSALLHSTRCFTHLKQPTMIQDAGSAAP